MDTEDFTFPKISDNHAYGIDSPPLWSLSPESSPNPYQILREGNKGDEKHYCFESKVVSNGQRKIFSSSVHNGRKKKGVDGEDDSMDLLWEGFNEELNSPRGSATSSSRELIEFKCATTALTVAKTSGALVQAKSSMVVIVKVLKKLFFFNTSQGKSRRRVL